MQERNGCTHNRIGELAHDAEHVSVSPMPDDDPTFEEEMEAMEKAPLVRGREILTRCGFASPPPDAVPESEVTGRLWELLYALAARRIFLHCTDHLTDAELYRWLHEEWLAEEQQDIDPRFGWNCRVDATGAGSDDPDDIWLRFYADDEERALCSVTDDKPLPPREEKKVNRDAFMPEPPIPPPGGDGGLPLDFDEEEDDLERADPLGLKDVDREIGAAPPPPPPVFQEPPAADKWERPVDQMQRTGFTPVPPDEITDAAVTPLLWELLHQLACRGFYVLHTDHLGDRQLYEQLWKYGIREDAQVPGKRSQTAAWFHDMIGSGSEEDTMIDLRFYSDDDSRELWLERWPDFPMPARQKPPYNRDWRLPKGPF